MTRDELASMLNNTEYPFQLPVTLIKEVTESNLVVIYGSSDDLFIFEGAIESETSFCGSSEALVFNAGILPSIDEIDTEEELAKWNKNKAQSKLIKSIWCDYPSEYSWIYETDIPHSCFDIVEDGDKYCKAIIINLNDL